MDCYENDDVKMFSTSVSIDYGAIQKNRCYNIYEYLLKSNPKVRKISLFNKYFRYMYLRDKPEFVEVFIKDIGISRNTASFLLKLAKENNQHLNMNENQFRDILRAVMPCEYMDILDWVLNFVKPNEGDIGTSLCWNNGNVALVLLSRLDTNTIHYYARKYNINKSLLLELNKITPIDFKNINSASAVEICFENNLLPEQEIFRRAVKFNLVDIARNLLKTNNVDIDIKHLNVASDHLNKSRSFKGSMYELLTLEMGIDITRILNNALSRQNFVLAEQMMSDYHYNYPEDLMKKFVYSTEVLKFLVKTFPAHKKYVVKYSLGTEYYDNNMKNVLGESLTKYLDFVIYSNLVTTEMVPVLCGV